ncbi:MAG: CcmD family protein [Deltaproteobacteria bacterium]|nr:CcmD family protein [Deltaproteobacteria bacterium]
MDTTNYLYAAYTVFWLIPTVYLFLLFKKTNNLNKKIDEALNKIAQISQG